MPATLYLYPQRMRIVAGHYEAEHPRMFAAQEIRRPGGQPTHEEVDLRFNSMGRADHESDRSALASRIEIHRIESRE